MTTDKELKGVDALIEWLDSRGPRVSEFAADFPRNEEGWLKLPRDIEFRRKLFPADAFLHPAKQPLPLVIAFTEYLTDPGDWILDPFGGIGSAALAARMGRNVILIELEPYYAETIKEACAILVPGGMPLEGADYWTWLPPSDNYGQIRLYIGDNRKVMLNMAEHTHPKISCIITSPPYALSVNRKGHELEAYAEQDKGKMKAYAGESAFNLSKLNSLYWEDAMAKVWERCAGLTETGATMAITCRDTIAAGQRDMLSLALVRQGGKYGFKYREWYKWALPSTLRTATNLKAGGGAVLDEDILILERE